MFKPGHDREVATPRNGGPRSEAPAKIWLPLDGKVIARLPFVPETRRWLQQAVQVRSPKWDPKQMVWVLPRNCATRLLRAAIDRFGGVEVYRDMTKLSRCTRSCLEAAGAECDCSCLGAHHGASSANWYEIPGGGEPMVTDLGVSQRIMVTYRYKQPDVGRTPRLYNGELSGRTYTITSRADWPRATEFICASCLTSQAEVWDHCHEHRDVRAPLCGRCNTHRWAGWTPQQGRPRATTNVDRSYYGWCRGYRPGGTPCSP